MTGAARAWTRAASGISPPTETIARRVIYRIVNEVPAVLMIAIVILAVVKPFGGIKSGAIVHRMNRPSKHKLRGPMGGDICKLGKITL